MGVVRANGKWKLTMKRDWKHPIAVLGLPLDRLTADGAVEAIEELILRGGTHQVATANLDFWLNSFSDRHLHRIIAGCSLVLAEGMPVVWVSKLLGCALPERVTGVDLVPKLAELSARKGYRIFLLGGKGNVAWRAARLLEEKYPGVQIVDTYAPSEEEMELLDQGALVERIQAAEAQILLVALGNPKQEKWIWMNRKRMGVPVAMGVGGSFEIIVGDLRHAPQWIQRCGLEWAMRLAQEPGRLGPRYVRDFVGLARRLPMMLLARWTQRLHLGTSHVTTVTTPQTMHVHLHGPLSAEIAAVLDEAAMACIESSQVMVVHFEDVKQMTASGLGALMGVRRTLLESGLTLALAGLKVKHRFLLYAWCASPLFDVWGGAAAHRRPMARETGPAGTIALSAKQDAIPAQNRARG
jgi:N-acetylglucosaminyldiphosphoundecaprenol N-acetyl-beta-D-mannosaminyltransferase